MKRAKVLFFQMSGTLIVFLSGSLLFSLIVIAAIPADNPPAGIPIATGVGIVGAISGAGLLIYGTRQLAPRRRRGP